MMEKIETPQYLAMRCDDTPTSCVNYGVVDTLTGKEVCRVWDEGYCRTIADLLNTRTTPASQSMIVDLDANDWESVKQAAEESSWIPKEHYFQNDWVSDVRHFLRTGEGCAPASQPAACTCNPGGYPDWDHDFDCPRRPAAPSQQEKNDDV